MTDTQPLRRADLLARLTTLQEKVVEVKELGGTVLIRELNGAQRIDASRAGQPDPEVQFDSALYYAAVVQMGALDPETREPIFTADDVPILVGGRFGALTALGGEIVGLSAMGPGDTKSGGAGADNG